MSSSFGIQRPGLKNSLSKSSISSGGREGGEGDTDRSRSGSSDRHYFEDDWYRDIRLDTSGPLVIGDDPLSAMARGYSAVPSHSPADGPAEADEEDGRSGSVGCLSPPPKSSHPRSSSSSGNHHNHHNHHHPNYHHHNYHSQRKGDSSCDSKQTPNLINLGQLATTNVGGIPRDRTTKATSVSNNLKSDNDNWDEVAEDGSRDSRSSAAATIINNSAPAKKCTQFSSILSSSNNNNGCVNSQSVQSNVHPSNIIMMKDLSGGGGGYSASSGHVHEGITENGEIHKCRERPTVLDPTNSLIVNYKRSDSTSTSSGARKKLQLQVPPGYSNNNNGSLDSGPLDVVADDDPTSARTVSYSSEHHHRDMSSKQLPGGGEPPGQPPQPQSPIPPVGSRVGYEKTEFKTAARKAPQVSTPLFHTS